MKKKRVIAFSNAKPKSSLWVFGMPKWETKFN